MRVLHVYKQYLPIRGGGIAAAQSIIEGLSGRVKSSVLSAAQLGFGGRLRVGDADIHNVVSVGYFNSMPIAPTLPIWLHVHARQADVIHVHLPFPIADVAINLWKLKIPVILHWHSDIIQQKFIKKLIRPLLRGTLLRADRIIVGSPRHIQSSNELLAYSKKCHFIPYGVDLEYWQAIDCRLQEEIADIHRSYPRMVLFAGRLVAYKGLKYLVEAMPRVNGHLVIAGAGPLETALRNQASSLGITERVHLLGEVSGRTLKTLYHACDIFVLPSIWPNEAFGLCQLEAMACHSPIINTCLPTGVPWVARHDIEALTVPPENPTALASAINRVLDSPELAAAMAARGAKRVSSMFDWIHTNERILQLYFDAIASFNSDGRSSNQ